MAIAVVPALAQTDLGLNEAARIGLGSSDPRVIIVRVIQVVLGFLALVAVVLVMYAGWTMMSSEGNAEKVEQAKKILKNAVIGLVIIFSAFAIVSFILNALTGSFVGGDDDDDDDDNGPGIEALGDGILKSVYPAPGQKDVVRNTSVIVTFREKMDPATICDEPALLDDAGEKCDTANAGCYKRCKGEKIKSENIRIFETDRGDACADENCDQNIADVKVFTNDNETFIFQPTDPLGSPSAEIYHTVKLAEDLKKADGKDAFGRGYKCDLDKSSGYCWSFEVSTKIDLTPPQVNDNGVFPTPDNERDGSSVTAGARATGSIKVNKKPQVYADSDVVKPPVKDPLEGNWPDVSVSGTYGCLNDGDISVTINSDSDLTVSVSSQTVKGLVSGDSAKDGNIAIGCGLSFTPVSEDFSAGNKWKLSVIAEKQADTLKVGSLEYVFVSGAGGENRIQAGTKTQTAANIAAALAGHQEVAAGIKSEADTVVELAAKNAGIGGNNIELATSNPENIQIGIMQGGRDREVAAIKKDKLDKARNAVIQINFNEAINPMTVSGEAKNVKNYIRVVNAKTDADGNPAAVAKDGQCSSDADCLSFKCRIDDKAATDAGCAESGACACRGDNDYLEGKFAVSNQYNTVEFVSNNQCGVNACGEAIYCLPANSHLKVVIKAAELED
ncbi:MAG: pilin, partial [Patescibacteria group bacterium]